MTPAAAVRLPSAFTVAVATLSLASCADLNLAEFERLVELCAVAENNGLLDPAAEGCSAALAIAESEGYPPDVLSSVLYRLGRLERQRSRFTRAGELLARSLAIEEASGPPSSVAMRLVELALALAGQERWLEGAATLERAAPLAATLEGRERKAAAGAFHLYAVRLRLVGETARADAFQRMREGL